MPTPSTPLHAWVEEFPYAVTVCDVNGIIIELNTAAAETFADSGGRDLIGRNLIECHPERARAVVSDLLATGRTNIYTIQKNGRHKLIVQSPWYRLGTFAGFVELSLDLPDSVPHFSRDATDATPPPQK